MLLNKVLDRKKKGLPYAVKGDYVNIDSLDTNLLAYLGSLEPEFQKMITITSGNDSEHSKSSRHYENNAVDIRFTPELYKRMEQDPKRREFGVILVDPKHGTAEHIHLSTGEGSENEKDVFKEEPRSHQMYDYMIKEHNYPPHIAAGIIGNLMVESGEGLDAGITSNFEGEGSYGLAQWNPSEKAGNRLGALKKFAKDNNKKIDDWKTQIDFLDYEIDSTPYLGKEELSKTQTAEEAAMIFSDKYERPNKEYANNDKRVSFANKLQEEISAKNKPNEAQTKTEGFSEFEPSVVKGTVGYTGNATYASMEEDIKKEPTSEADTEKRFREILEDYAKKREQTQPVSPLNQPDQGPQQRQKQASANTDYLYQIIDIDNFEEGGQLKDTEKRFREILEDYAKKRDADNFEDGGKYKVKSGDSLSKIAKANNTTVENLVTLNPSLKGRESKIQIGESFNLTSTPEKTKVTGPTLNEGAGEFDFSTYIPQIDNLKTKTTEDNPYKYEPKSNFQPRVIESTSAARREVPTLERIDPNRQRIKQESLDQKINKVKETNSSKIRLDTQYVSEFKGGIVNKDLNIKEVQSFLFNNGYDLDPNNKFKNSGVDGKLGPVTQNAIDDYNNNNNIGDNLENPYKSMKVNPDNSKKGFLDKCSEGQCSEYLQNEIVRNINPNMTREEWNNAVGITGDAWDLRNNMVKKGGRVVPLPQMREGDVVGINSGTGGATLRKAQKAGSNYTHSGIIDKVNEDGTYYVLHDWHKRVDNEYIGQEFRTLVDPKTNKLPGFTGTGVIEVIRPNYSGAKLQDKVEARTDVRTKVNKDRVVGNESQIAETVDDKEFKSKLLNREGIDEDEYYSIAKAAFGIMGQETNFGSSIKYSSNAKAFFSALAIETSLKTDEQSVGPGSMKLRTNFNTADIGFYNVNRGNIKEPRNAMKATMLKVTRDYKRMMKKGHSKKESMYRAIQIYNSGNLGKDVGTKIVDIPGSKAGGILNKTRTEGKSREEFAKEYDLDYVNKVINFGKDLLVTGEQGEFSTIFDQFLIEKNVIKWEDRIEKKKVETVGEQILSYL